jgi:hypothetical protein
MYANANQYPDGYTYNDLSSLSPAAVEERFVMLDTMMRQLTGRR